MPRLARDRLTWLTYAQLSLWAYIVYSLGPAVPLLRDEQHVSRGLASLHGTGLAAGAVIGGVVFPRLVRRLGRARVVWVGLGGLAVSVIAFCLARPLPLTVEGAVVLDLFGTFVACGVAATLNSRHGSAAPAALAEANAVAVGMGILAPLAVGASVRAGLGWRPGMGAVVVLIGALALAQAIVRVPAPAAARRTAAARVEAKAAAVPAVPAAMPAVAPAAGADPARRRPERLPRAYWLACSLIALTGSVEACLSLWSSDELRRHAGMSAAGAATALSGILVGMLAGRLAGGRIALRVSGPRLMLAALGVSACGFVVFWLGTAPWLAAVGLVLCGFGNGMHYPLSIGMALDAAPGQADLAAARSSYAIAIAYGVAPLVLGSVADAVGTHRAFVLVLAFLAAAALVTRTLVAALPASAPAIATTG